MHDDPSAIAAFREWGAILDEELARLPAVNRDALIVCLMEGQSYADAARRLGWPLGTLKSRLLRGRTMLRKRLEERGVVMSDVALSVTMSEATKAAVPAGLIGTTLQGAVGKVVSAKVAALASTAVRALSFWKLKLVLCAVLVAGAAGFGAVAAGLGGKSQDKQDDAATISRAAQEAKPPIALDAFGDPLPAGAMARIGSVRWQHGSSVHFVTMPPDGKTVISAANDRFVRIWDMGTGKELRRIGPGVAPNHWTGSSGVRYLAGGSPPFGGRLPAAVCVAVSLDGKVLATHFDGPTVELWDAATGKMLQTIALNEDSYEAGGLAFAADGKTLAIASARGRMWLCNIATGKIEKEFGVDSKQKQPTNKRQSAVLCAPDAKSVVAVYYEGDERATVSTVRFWDPQTGKEQHSTRVPSGNRYGIGMPLFSPDGRSLAFTTSESEICVLSTATGEVLAKWHEDTREPFLAFSADSNRLYSMYAKAESLREVDYWRRQDVGYLLKEWDVATGKVTRDPAFPGPNLKVTNGAMTLSPDGKWLVYAKIEGDIGIYDLQKGEALPRFGRRFSGLDAPVFTGDSKFLVLFSEAGLKVTDTLWDVKTGRQAAKGSGPTDRSGRYFVREGTIDGIKAKRVCDTETDTVVAVLPSTAKDRIRDVFSPDGRTLMVFGHDEVHGGGLVVLYDVPSFKERCRVPTPRSEINLGENPIFFSADSRLLVVYLRSGLATVYDAMTGKALRKVQLEQSPPLRSAAFSPDGRCMAIDRNEGTVALLEMASGQVRGILGGENVGKRMMPPSVGSTGIQMGSAVWYGISSTAMVAFSPDGSLLAFGGAGTVLEVWATSTGKSVARFEGHSGLLKAIGFSPDGQKLASLSRDQTILVWDVQGLYNSAAAEPVELKTESTKIYCNDLPSTDAKKADKAIKALVGAGQPVVAYLKTVIKPVPGLDATAVGKLIADLDSAEFKVRERASAELLKMGEPVVPFLDRRLAEKLPLETRQRLQLLRGKLAVEGALTGERLREVRAIEVLERIGNAEAREFLQALAAGGDGALVTEEAKETLRRLRRAP
jgi:WD40 repeat protein